MKTAKKKVAKKPVAKKKSAQKIKVKEEHFRTAPEQFRVDMESPTYDPQTGVTGYVYAPDTYATDESLARDAADTLKQMGVGGRLLKLDGTPDGQVVERWGSIGRILEAGKVETAALEQEKK